MTQPVLPINENRCINVLIVLMLIKKLIHTLQITYNFYLLNKLGLNVNLPRGALTEKSHAFHMQIMRGTHVTYMCV